ncbi:MAG: uroporphyrinogen decarboxylase family protein, partial [Patescibacteria group bacterium]
REVVRRAVEFKGPDRLPLRFEALGLSDIFDAGWNQTGVGDKALRETVDEWGCVWRRSEVANMGQVKGHPLADWSALKSFAWPDPDDPAFYAGMEERLAAAGDRYVMTSVFMLLFERMHALHGFENTLADLHLERGRLEELADRIVAFDLGLIENISRRFPGAIQGFSFTDDWGTELATFISPALWRDFFKPRYRRIFDAAHTAGWHVWMHTCGKVNGIMEDLIDIGLDAINLQQPRALGIEEIGRRFRGRICFESLCDIQATLPFKDEKEIAAEAALLLEHWAAPGGGFVLSDYGDGGAIGVPPEKKRAMLEAFLAADPWRT